MLSKKISRKESIKLTLENFKGKTFATIKACCLSDCKNHLDIRHKGTLDFIEDYLICAYEAGKVEGKK